ncbi:hypothetical protein DEO72_LG11g2040 [Vigna unguiculata]|uniref:Uncharacterized protein n=1 Tax=Vigna unguiculata TaxID=3917 RepID=A0A4D6NPW7_VIGUN|nr:hypothetical protein DEO72_LG11g2040 [Vigna unguiculata]
MVRDSCRCFHGASAAFSGEDRYVNETGSCRCRCRRWWLAVVARNKLRGGDLQWRWHDGAAKLWCEGEKMEEDGVVMVSAMVVGKSAGTSMVAAGVAGEGGVRDNAVGREKKMVALRGGRRDWRRRLCGGWKGN